MSSESSVAEPFSKLSSFRCLHLSVLSSSTLLVTMESQDCPSFLPLPNLPEPAGRQGSPRPCGCNTIPVWLETRPWYSALGNGTNVTRNRLFGKQSCHQLQEKASLKSWILQLQSVKLSPCWQEPTPTSPPLPKSPRTLTNITVTSFSPWPMTHTSPAAKFPSATSLSPHGSRRDPSLTFDPPGMS